LARLSAETPDILTEVLHGFNQSLQENVRMIPDAIYSSYGVVVTLPTKIKVFRLTWITLMNATLSHGTFATG
jgi:hypothetical protein